MSPLHSHKRLAVAVVSALALLAGGPISARGQTVLSDNLPSDNAANVSGGADAATGSTWLTASFGTGATASSLGSITLLLENSVPGTAALFLYSDASNYTGGSGLQPGSLVATLSSPSAYATSSLGNTTFTASGVALAANTTYWAVLEADSGEFDWSFDNADPTIGTGVGFQGQLGNSPDAGATWFTGDTYPYQMCVTAAAPAAPEPSVAVALTTGVGLVGIAFLRRRRAQV